MEFHAAWLIPFMWIGVVMLGKQLRHRRRMEELRLTRSRPEESVRSDRDREEILALRERVKVLERIATDKSVRLADEIESLRD